ncbi:hypothetical protein MLD38_021500 [Melastoma candidum]|uniref:Uncharacterized protein n=1 Tax=Melastoma candidum TaxID=119954 RepID=A0ACB9QGF9_9MYRT|nr:hypothetical protein MLD38_021500 [Melastoma candidum]
MVRLLGITIGESDESPTFFCKWIAVSYLYKHDHQGVRDYLCNCMHTLPLSGIESYLFQICYIMVHKPSLDKFVIDICTKSLKIAMKVQWFLMAELEDNDNNEGISRIQEKCQIAATLTGEWPPLIQPQNSSARPGNKNQVLSRILSSKQKLLSLASSPNDKRRSFSFSPSMGNNLQQEVGHSAQEENNIFKKLIPVQRSGMHCCSGSQWTRMKKTRKRKGFLRAEEDEKEGFFRKLLREKFEDKKDRNEDKDKGISEDKSVKSSEDEEKDGFFRKFSRESDYSVCTWNMQKNNVSADSSTMGSLSESSPGTENFFRKIFKDSDRSFLDSEMFGSKKNGEVSFSFQMDTTNPKPPLPMNSIAQLRKGAHHESLDFVQSLCDTSYGLVDIFPVEDRKSALRESLASINMR